MFDYTISSLIYLTKNIIKVYFSLKFVFREKFSDLLSWWQQQQKRLILPSILQMTVACSCQRNSHSTQKCLRCGAKSTTTAVRAAIEASCPHHHCYSCYLKKKKKKFLPHNLSLHPSKDCLALHGHRLGDCCIASRKDCRGKLYKARRVACCDAMARNCR